MGVFFFTSIFATLDNVVFSKELVNNLYITLNAQCVHPMLMKINASCYSGGTRTHDLQQEGSDN